MCHTERACLPLASVTFGRGTFLYHPGSGFGLYCIIPIFCHNLTDYSWKRGTGGGALPRKRYFLPKTLVPTSLQGVNMGATLKTEQKVIGGNSKSLWSLPSRAFHPAFPTQGIVNIGWKPQCFTEPLCPASIHGYRF